MTWTLIVVAALVHLSFFFSSNWARLTYSANDSILGIFFYVICYFIFSLNTIFPTFFPIIYCTLSTLSSYSARFLAAILIIASINLFDSPFIVSNIDGPFYSKILISSDSSDSETTSIFGVSLFYGVHGNL